MNDDLNIFNLIYGYVNIGKKQIHCGGFATHIPQMSRVWVNFFSDNDFFLKKSNWLPRWGLYLSYIQIGM